MPSRAVAALDLSGPLSLQSRDAARGLELWSALEGVELEVVDIGGSSDRALDAYRSWAGDSRLLVLGPYGSGPVRTVLASVPGIGLLWNHGGSANDLARPWAPMVPAPASTYFVPLVDTAVMNGCDRLTLVKGSGRFAKTVIDGARRHALGLGLATDVVDVPFWQPGEWEHAHAFLVVGRFEDDVSVVSRLGKSGRPRVVGCVAAGIAEFGQRLGAGAEGVLGPSQWFPDESDPELGPSGIEFADQFSDRFGMAPSYVAAQAAAAGYLGLSAAEQELSPSRISGWETSTLLGSFRVDQGGLQVGHRVSMGRWQRGQFVPA